MKDGGEFYAHRQVISYSDYFQATETTMTNKNRKIIFEVGHRIDREAEK